jgi:hypothetical protein
MEEMLNGTNVGQTTEVQPTTTEQPFRVFKTQKEFDDFSAHLIKKTEDKALKNAKVTDGEVVFNKEEYIAKVRKDIEANAIAEYERKLKMTEQERLAEETRKRNEEFRDREIALNKREATTYLKEAGFDDEQMEVYLELVTEDRETSLGKIKRICDTQKSTQEKLHKKWQEELQASNPSINIGSQDINALQSQYNEAKASGNMALVAKIIRMAQATNVTLKD